MRAGGRGAFWMGPTTRYRLSLDNPDGFWRDAAMAIDWIELFGSRIDRRSSRRPAGSPAAC